jgi:hypothetical protein
MIYKKDYRMNEAINLVERYLPLGNWDFKQASRFFASIDPVVIYRSEKCKVRISLTGPEGYGMDPWIVIHYGRLDVPSTASIALSSAEEKEYHHLWHNVRHPLYLLDGLSPQEAKNARDPRFIVEFEQSDQNKNIRYEPEKGLIMHAKIWETYGQRLFDIFDLRNKELWKQYCVFVREYWEVIPKV